MKNIIFILLLALLTSFSFNTERVPSIVQEALQNQFPSAMKIRWHKSMDSLRAPLYEADFYDKGKYKIIIYTIIGNPLELEEDMLYSELPEEIKENIVTWDFVSSYKAYSYELDNTYYHVTYKTSKNRFVDVYYDQECNITEKISYYHNPNIGYVLITGVFITFVIMLF